VQGVRIDAEGKPDLAAGQTLVALVRRKSNGHRLAIIDRPAREGRSVIRGLHFVDDDPPRRTDRREVPENQPPGADILNPESVACFIRLVYQRYYDQFGPHFGKTVKAIFTDEPSLLARGAERGMIPGTTGILEHINRFLGYDFTEYLPALWYEDEPEAEMRRRDYNRAIQGRLEETFYRQISDWCGAHGVALTGHPMGPDDIGHLRHFHIPGQDIVWRYIEPGKASAIEGAQSTQGKCASSAMIHLKRRRNLNECCGAYGHNFTFEEMQWLAHWLLVERLAGRHPIPEFLRLGAQLLVIELLEFGFERIDAGCGLAILLEQPVVAAAEDLGEEGCGHASRAARANNAPASRQPMILVKSG